jgi:hypothetical protein
VSRRELDVLIPTRDRPVELATTLAGLAGQDFPGFGVIISDQSDGAASYDTPAARTMLRVLDSHGCSVRTGRHLPRRGMAEHRGHLLNHATAPYVLFLDDDVWLEPGTLRRLHTAITTLGCGFVGNAVQGLSYLDDYRPDELAVFEPWNGKPQPEQLGPDHPGWQRKLLHNAANPTHLARKLALEGDDWLAYKVAWIGACVLFDRQALLAVGGFDFWPQLPANHSGEDVLAELRVMAKFGGAGILPSGAVHLEAPTTVEQRDVEAYEQVSLS